MQIEQIDRDAAAKLTGDEAMAYGMADLSDAVQAFARHRPNTAPNPPAQTHRRTSSTISILCGDHILMVNKVCGSSS